MLLLMMMMLLCFVARFFVCWHVDARCDSHVPRARRVVYCACSPDGQTVVTGAGDETLRFWHVFDKERAAAIDHSQLDLVHYIR
jgi:WD40 repeat protein